MMAKLALLALAFTALVALPLASSLRSSITTTNVGMPDLKYTDSSEQQTCRQQIQKEWVRDCKKYLTSRSPYAGDVLRMSVMDPRQEQEKEHLSDCCEELRGVVEVADECVCKAVRLAFREAQREQQSGHHGGEEKQQRQLLHKAQNIPSECKLQMRECSIPSLMF